MANFQEHKYLHFSILTKLREKSTEINVLGLKANKDCMEPSLFFVLFWRLAVDVLYPYSYMDSFLEDVLANEHLVWTPGSRLTRHLLTVTRDAFRTILMMVMLMEMFQGLDAALNIPAAANRQRRRL